MRIYSYVDYHPDQCWNEAPADGTAPRDHDDTPLTIDVPDQQWAEYRAASATIMRLQRAFDELLMKAESNA